MCGSDPPAERIRAWGYSCPACLPPVTSCNTSPKCYNEYPLVYMIIQAKVS
jgi:hypothetical protein